MSFVSLYLYVPDEGSLLPKYRDCTTSNDFESYIHIYIYNSKSLDVVQSLYFGSKLPSSGTFYMYLLYIYIYICMHICYVRLK